MTLDCRMPDDDDPVVKQILDLCPEAADEVRICNITLTFHQDWSSKLDVLPVASSWGLSDNISLMGVMHLRRMTCITVGGSLPPWVAP